MMRLRIGLCLIAMLAAPLAAQQTVRDDGKAFAEAAARATADLAGNEATATTNLPNYNGANAPEKSYLGNPTGLDAAKVSIARTNEASVLVVDGSTTRPQVPRSQVDQTIARGGIINQDPATYARGVAADGTTGTCVELPPTSTSPGTFEATCNVGQKIVDEVRSCSVLLKPNFNEAHGYQCSTIRQRGDVCLQGSPNNCTEPDFVDQEIGSGCAALQLPACSVSLVKTTVLRAGTFRNAATYYEEYAATCSAAITGSVTGTSIVAGGITYAPTFTDVGVVKTYAGATHDTTQCASLEATSGCAAQGPEACTDATPETRVVDGVSITQSCWAWQRNYQCNGVGTGNDCSALDANTACHYARTDCLDDPRSGPCKVEERVYACPVPGNPTPEKQMVCGGDVYCIRGDCEAVTREASTEFKDAAVGLNSLGQAAREFDQTDYKLFKGVGERCSKPVFALANCCGGNGIPIIGVCSAEDRQLAVKIDKGLVHYVGTYCSKSFLGICTSKARTYCSFQSKLTRILQEQGRPQIGKTWGPVRTPDCAGFAIDEFARLDLSIMDFAEIYQDFVTAAKLPDEAATMTDIQARIKAYYSAKGG